MRLIAVSVAAALGVCAASVASAQVAQAQTAAGGGTDRRSDVTFRLGTGHSDNVFLATSQEESGTYTGLGVLVDLARESTRVTATVTSDIEFRSYSTAGIDDEPYGNFAARAEFFAVPDRFSWIIDDQYGQGRIDPFNAIGPANQEQINVISTGPALYWPIGSRTELRLSSLVGRRDYQSTFGLDNDTLESTAGIFRQMSSTAEIGVNVSRREVEYGSPNIDNTIDRAYFSYRKALANGEASLLVGTNQVDYETTSESHPFFDVAWSRAITSRTTLGFAFQSSLVDGTDNFQTDQGFNQELFTSDVSKRVAGEANVTIVAGRSQFRFVGRIGEDRYQSTNVLDNDLMQLAFNYDRAITPLLTAGFTLNSVDRDFQTVDQQDEDLRAQIYVERLFGRQLALNVSYQHAERDGVNVSTYQENSIRVMVHYGLNGRTTTDRQTGPAVR